MYLLTSQKSYELRVDMSDFEGDTRYAVYDSFSVGAPVDKYRLDLGNFLQGDAGKAGLYSNVAVLSTTALTVFVTKSYSLCHSFIIIIQPGI